MPLYIIHSWRTISQEAAIDLVRSIIHRSRSLLLVDLPENLRQWMSYPLPILENLEMSRIHDHRHAMSIRLLSGSSIAELRLRSLNITNVDVTWNPTLITHLELLRLDRQSLDPLSMRFVAEVLRNNVELRDLELLYVGLDDGRPHDEAKVLLPKLRRVKVEGCCEALQYLLGNVQTPALTVLFILPREVDPPPVTRLASLLSAEAPRLTTIFVPGSRVVISMGWCSVDIALPDQDSGIHVLTENPIRTLYGIRHMLSWTNTLDLEMELTNVSGLEGKEQESMLMEVLDSLRSITSVRMANCEREVVSSVLHCLLPSARVEGGPHWLLPRLECLQLNGCDHDAKEALAVLESRYSQSIVVPTPLPRQLRSLFVRDCVRYGLMGAEERERFRQDLELALPYTAVTVAPWGT